MVNKDDLIEKVTNRTRLTHKDVEEVVNALLEQIIEILSMGEKVNLTGFGAERV